MHNWCIYNYDFTWETNVAHFTRKEHPERPKFFWIYLKTLVVLDALYTNRPPVPAPNHCLKVHFRNLFHAETVLHSAKGDVRLLPDVPRSTTRAQILPVFSFAHWIVEHVVVRYLFRARTIRGRAQRRRRPEEGTHRLNINGPLVRPTSDHFLCGNMNLCQDTSL